MGFIDHSPHSSNDQGVDRQAIRKVVGAVGIPMEILERRGTLGSLANGISQALQTILCEGGQLVLQSCDGTLSDVIINAIDPSRGHGAKCEKVVLFALRLSESGRLLGFVLLGVQSRCRFDDDYQKSIELLGSQFATALVSTIMLQEELKRREEQARLEQATLKTELQRKPVKRN